MNAPIKVLILGDEWTSLSLLDDVATSISLDVVIETDLCSARITVATWMPDVAIFDLMLPDGKSTELLAEIRAARLPMAVALLTGSEDPEKIAGFYGLGADEVFCKPVNPELIGHWLQSRQKSPQRQPQRERRTAHASRRQPAFRIVVKPFTSRDEIRGGLEQLSV